MMTHEDAEETVEECATQFKREREEKTTPTRKKACYSPEQKEKQENYPIRVAIIVPFRDNHAIQKRQLHLDQFVPHMTNLLQKQTTISSFHIFIIEQSHDGRKFNRGKLLNAGFDIAREDYDVFVFHDVDLLPGEDLAAFYGQFPTNPFHIAKVWDRYNQNPQYFGGIVSFSKQDFFRINGYPNNFWGWGGEDDELLNRVKKRKLKVDGPESGTIVDLEKMNLDEKLDLLRKSKWKCTIKWNLLQEHHVTWKKNGLSSLSYQFLDATSISNHCTRIKVELGSNGHWSDARSSLERKCIGHTSPEDKGNDSEEKHKEVEGEGDDFFDLMIEQKKIFAQLAQLEAEENHS